jgi:hypothetical protein
MANHRVAANMNAAKNGPNCHVLDVILDVIILKDRTCASPWIATSNPREAGVGALLFHGEVLVLPLVLRCRFVGHESQGVF